VQRPQRRRHLCHRFGLAQPLRRHLLPLDEAGHQARRVVEHRHHRRADACRRGQLARRALRLAVDLQQCRVLAGQPHHHVLAGEPHPVVAVGDPALERDGVAFEFAEARRDRSEGVCEGGHGRRKKILSRH
jgi:hypothetical protein